jgi:ribonuclease D
MSVQLIKNQEDARHLSKTLNGQNRLAIDLEAAGFHRYSDKVCLLQITSGDNTFLVDTLSVDPSNTLRPLFQDPNVLLVLHGGVFDLRLLHRDLQIFPLNLFDTQIAASLVGEPSLGLAALLKKYFGIELSKKYQKADWAKRPLSDEMLEYAAADTQSLCLLSDLFIEKLQDLDRLSWATEESRALADLRWKSEPNSAGHCRQKDRPCSFQSGRRPCSPGNCKTGIVRAFFHQ